MATWLTPEKEKEYRKVYLESQLGPVPLPDGGGAVDMSGGDPYEGMGEGALRYDAPGGGYAIIPRAAVQDPETGEVTNPELMKTIETGKPRMQRDEEMLEQSRQMKVENFGRRLGRERQAEKVADAKRRMEEGNMTVGDALVLDLPITPGGGSQQDRVDKQYNFRRRQEIQQQEALAIEEQRRQDAMLQQAIKAGTAVPQFDESGRVTGYAAPLPEQPEQPWTPQAVDLDGDGVPDGVMTSPRSYQPNRPESEGIGEQETYNRRRRFQQDRNRAFPDEMGENTLTPDNYYRQTYNDDGTLKEGAAVRADVEQHIDYLNEQADGLGIPKPFPRGNEKPTDDKGAAAAPAAKPGVPEVGFIRNGYRFKGGDPAKKENLEKVAG